MPQVHFHGVLGQVQRPRDEFVRTPTLKLAENLRLPGRDAPTRKLCKSCRAFRRLIGFHPVRGVPSCIAAGTRALGLLRLLRARRSVVPLADRLRTIDSAGKQEANCRDGDLERRGRRQIPFDTVPKRLGAQGASSQSDISASGVAERRVEAASMPGGPARPSFSLRYVKQ